MGMGENKTTKQWKPIKLGLPLLMSYLFRKLSQHNPFWFEMLSLVFFLEQLKSQRISLTEVLYCIIWNGTHILLFISTRKTKIKNSVPPD